MMVVLAVPADAAQLAAIKISEGFNLGYCKAKLGHGPEMLSPPQKRRQPGAQNAGQSSLYVSTFPAAPNRIFYKNRITSTANFKNAQKQKCAFLSVGLKIRER